MRAYVTVEQHYRERRDGIYVRGVEDHVFFSRYLHEFDDVVVIARVTKSEAPPAANEKRADGPGVRFHRLPEFRGLSGLARNAPRVASRLFGPATDDAVFILRVPGAVSTMVWAALAATRRPFGIELVTDPAQAYMNGSLGSASARLVRRVALRVLHRQCASAAAAAYVTSERLQAHYPAATAHVFSYSSIDLEPHVLDRARHTQERLAEQPDAPSPARLVFVGALDRPFKGLDVLLRALAEVRAGGRETELVVVGDGQLRNTYEELASELGLSEHVDFLGHLPSGDAVYDVVQTADVFVLPSRREGLPRVLIEAMAVGVPCVSTDVSGARELLSADDIVPIGDIAALARKIAELIGSRALRLETSHRNVAVARRYTRARLMAERVKFYRALKAIRTIERAR